MPGDNRPVCLFGHNESEKVLTCTAIEQMERHRPDVLASFPTTGLASAPCTDIPVSEASAAPSERSILDFSAIEFPPISISQSILTLAPEIAAS